LGAAVESGWPESPESESPESESPESESLPSLPAAFCVLECLPPLPQAASNDKSQAQWVRIPA
jgi:hypothetical protein